MEYAELRDEVFALFAERLDPECWCYHSTVHTAFVLEDVLTFGRRAGVAAENLELLRIAALFHDTGFIFDPENHEAASAAFARERLSAVGMPAARVAQVERLILATRVPTAPADLLEAVICDADIGQMATGCFLWLGARLRRELARNGMVFDEPQWYEFELNFYRTFHFHSDAARAMRQEGWERNREFYRRASAQFGRGCE